VHAQPRGLEGLHDLVEQVPDTGAVLGRDLHDRFEAKLVELRRAGARPLVVGLVHRDHHRQTRLPQLAGNRLVS
jgi:hypothetical protein